MEIRLRSLVLVLSLFSGSVFAQIDTEVFEKAAEEYANAVEKENFEKILTFTHPKVLQQFGGKRQMLAAAERDAQATKQKGFTMQKAELAEALTLMDTNGYVFWCIPIRVTMKGPFGKVYSEAGLLGISEDKGKSYTFVSLAQIDLAVLLTLFPDIPTELEMPTKQLYTE